MEYYNYKLKWLRGVFLNSLNTATIIYENLLSKMQSIKTLPPVRVVYQVSIKIVFIAVLIIFAMPVFAQNKNITRLEKTITVRKTELENIQNQLEEKQLRLKFLESEEKDHIERLYSIEEQLNLNNRLIIKIQKQLDDLGDYISDLEANLEYNSNELARQEKILLERLVWIYKRSRIPPLLTALSAGDLLQGARRLYLFSLLNKYDRKIVAEIESLNRQIKTEKADLQKRRNSIVALKSEKERQAKNIRINRQKRKILLKRAQTQKGAELKAIEQLVSAQERISGIIDVLLQNKAALNKQAAKEFLNLKGKLIWPVRGKIIRHFGKIKDKKYNTVITNPGIDIKASAEMPVYASSSGKAAYISWLRGYGSFIILEHGGGYYTLYAHLDDIFVETGQFVTAGETLATVSETGTFSGPMLHFELRFGKEQLDPVPWLR